MESIDKLQSFRQFFPKRRDALMDLIDSLSSNLYSGSVVQLSLNASFRRKYSSITKVIGEFSYQKKKDR